MPSPMLGRDLPRFTREFLGPGDAFTAIGNGAIGGKAGGLLKLRDLLSRRRPAPDGPSAEVAIPRTAIVCTDHFLAFLETNDLEGVVASEDDDRRLAATFQAASLPVELAGDLRGLAEQVRTPIAVRSSSLLEDALGEPFAGVYATKMVPNDAPDADTRFRKLAAAVKLVWASSFFAEARAYRRAVSRRGDAEEMAIVIQEVVGEMHGRRFYPHLSGVAKSYDYYPQKGVRPGDGVVSLALGLGKTIVDGDRCWSYSPSRPRVGPPFSSAADLLDGTQRTFWSVAMGEPKEWNPISETEYLVRGTVEDADYDGVLGHLASTYDHRSDRMTPGVGSPGPRALTFAPLLVHETYPLNRTVVELLRLGRQALGTPVEIEFAATLPRSPGGSIRIGFLQVRSLAVSGAIVDVEEADLVGPGVLLSSANAMGNGDETGILDIVYVVPSRFEASRTAQVAREIAEINRGLVENGRPYLLIGFGRWGSSDPWLGIPVRWADIAGARALVEATLPAMNVEISQGSHFFHNLSSFRVSYFSVPFDARPGVDWDWLALRPAVTETAHVRHVRAEAAVRVRVDGRSGRGVVLR